MDFAWPISLLAIIGGWLVYKWFTASGAPHTQSQTQAASIDGKRMFTRKEVAAHATSDDLWVIIRSQEHQNQARVYNLTDYVEEHPGGQAILNSAGGDSTKGFYGPQHPPKVFDMIEDFFIGLVAE